MHHSLRAGRVGRSRASTSGGRSEGTSSADLTTRLLASPLLLSERHSPLHAQHLVSCRPANRRAFLGTGALSNAEVEAGLRQLRKRRRLDTSVSELDSRDDLSKSLADWTTFADAGVARMQTWWVPDDPVRKLRLTLLVQRYMEKDNDYQNVGWWQMPVMLFSYMDLDRALNRTSNEAAVAKLLDDTRGKSYMTTDYVDDQCGSISIQSIPIA